MTDLKDIKIVPIWWSDGCGCLIPSSNGISSSSDDSIILFTGIRLWEHKDKDIEKLIENFYPSLWTY